MQELQLVWCPHNLMIAIVKKISSTSSKLALAMVPKCPSPLDLGFLPKFRCPVTIADVSKPILSADFLHQSDLLVYLACECLIDGQTYSTTAKTSHEKAFGPSSVSPPGSYCSMLESYPSLTNLCFKCSKI